MSATAYAPALRPTRPSSWRPLLWLLPLTAAWIVVSYAFPGLGAGGVPAVAVRLAITMALALGLWLGLERTALAPARRLWVFAALAVPYILWQSIIWSAAISGAFAPGGGLPPKLPLAIFLPVILFTPPLLLSKRVGELLDAMPETWLVGLQVYRVFGAAFLVGWAQGIVPGIFGLPAGIGDVSTGLMALPAALALAAGAGGARRGAIAWNIFGLVDFAVAVGIGLAIAPGPFQLIHTSIVNTVTGSYPGVMVPAFIVPSSILLHALSLRQLRRRGRNAA
jgi:hypothetical protein